MFDPLVIASGLFVGFVVGLTGMGGGALMTPILVMLFHIEPLAAVSSDIVAAMVMKPIGGAVHWQRGTVQRGLVTWLMLGSIPTAFLGVLLLRRLDAGIAVQAHIKLALGLALLVVVTGLVVRPLLISRRGPPQPFELKRFPTLLIGIVGGLVVGLTSVGSGSLIIIALLMLYPRMSLSELVGTDLVQAVPLVASAAIGHLLFGNFKLGLTVSILIGSLPGVFIGWDAADAEGELLIEMAAQGAGIPFDDAFGDGEVGFVKKVPVLLQDAFEGLGLGKDDEAGGVAVETVDDPDAITDIGAAHVVGEGGIGGAAAARIRGDGEPA